MTSSLLSAVGDDRIGREVSIDARQSSAGGHRLLLTGFFFSGVAALVYEVVWTRALSLVLGSTTYAVSTMLATFMSGLALGGFLAGRRADRVDDPARYFGLCELGIAVTAIVSVPLLNLIPHLFLPLYRSLHVKPALFFPMQVALCALVMLVPTVLMGATFPFLIRAVTSRLEDLGSRVGTAYACNTMGAVIGALVGGFLFVPTLGLRLATVAAALINLAVGSAILLAPGRRRFVAPLVAALAVAGGAAVLARGEDQRPVVSFYNAHRHFGAEPYAWIADREQATYETLALEDMAEGRVTSLRSTSSPLLLDVGGKIEGTGPWDLDTTLLLARLPAVAHAGPRSMLVVGLGSGATVEAAKAEVGQVDVVEIHPGVVEAVRRFGTPGLLDGVGIEVDDARRFLAMTESKWDIISAEPSYPTDPSVVHLFTVEHFEAVARRLEPGGVACQWLPYYMLADADVDMMVKTFASVFPHVTVWRVPRSLDLLLLGSLEPPSRSPTEILAILDERSTEATRPRVELSRGTEEVRTIAVDDSIPINTDDRPLLEFRVVRNLLAGPQATRATE